MVRSYYLMAAPSLSLDAPTADDQPPMEIAPDTTQQWVVALGQESWALAAPASLTVWTALADFSSGRARIDVSLSDCAVDLSDCRPLLQGGATAPDWGEGTGGYVERTLDLRGNDATLDQGRSLVLSITAHRSTPKAVWIAVGRASAPTALTLNAS